MDNISYHGTKEDSAKTILGPPPGVNINVGKGELGKGFYTGSSVALAAIWAQNRFPGKAVVIEFDIPKERFVQLKGKVIKTHVEVAENWNKLKDSGEVKTFEFGHDYIIAPFATIEHTGNQYKFESKKAEIELNAAVKKIYKCD